MKLGSNALQASTFFRATRHTTRQNHGPTLEARPLESATPNVRARISTPPHTVTENHHNDSDIRPTIVDRMGVLERDLTDLCRESGT